MRTRLIVLAFTFVSSGASVAWGQTVEGLDPHVKAIATASPPSIRLEWEKLANTTSITVRRREGGAGAWVTVGDALAATTTSFDDTKVEKGKTFEYNVQRRGTESGNAYVLAGIEVPFEDDPGVVVLVIDKSMAAPLSAAFARLEADLVAEGFEVVREEVEETAKPPEVRAKIQAARTTHGARLRYAFLLGGVPRVFSGLLNPDGHPDHRGAWPADGYYGDVDGTWPDTADLGGEGIFVNKPGDGKFDPTRIPSDLEVAVGRVDTIDLPAFAPASASDLLKKYLDRDHAYRVSELRFKERTWVSDSFGYFSGEAFSRIAWRDSWAVYGVGPASGKPFFDALDDPEGYAFAFGCGGGNPTGAGGVGSTADFAKRAPKAMFIGLFGSYFGDWSYKDAFMRAALASGALESIWFARPHAHMHALGALRTYGDAFLATANNQSTYDTGSSPRSVHISLLGDPTLRAFVARAPSALVASKSAAGVALSWKASGETPLAGHHVYRRVVGAKEAPVRLTSAPIAATEYVDGETTPGTKYAYRVVSVILRTTGSGTFFQHSPGAMTEAEGVAKADPDAGPIDLDAGSLPLDDAGNPIAADPGPAESKAGCSCRVGSERSVPPLSIGVLGVLLGLLGLRARRR